MTNNPLLQQVLVAIENNSQKDALAFVNQIVDFMINNENGRVFEGWPRETLVQLTAYHLAKGTLIYAVKDGKLDGVLMWYKCNEAQQDDFLQNWMPDNPNGDSIFLAVLFANSKGSFRKLAIDVIAMEPDILTKKLLGLRCKRGAKFGEKVKYDLRLFNKILKFKD